MKKLLVLFAAALFSLSASAAKADTLGVSFTDPGSVLNNGNGYSLGYAFTVNNAITINGLGYFDNGGLLETHQVGLYDSNGTLLASATVTNAGTQQGFFNFTSIADLTLAAGQTYQVMGTSGFQDLYTWDTVGFNTDPNITFAGDRYTSGDALAFGLAGGGTHDGFFGANIRISSASPVPEPGSLVLLGTGLIGAIGVVRRKLQS